MTSMLGARKHAEDFDAVVSGLPLAGRREVSPELAQLTGVVTALRQHRSVTPRQDFAVALRERLLVEAETVLRPEAKSLTLPVRRRGTRERRLVAAATAVVFVGGTAGMAAAAQGALPGDALYPLKRGIERAQTTFSTSDAGKGHDLLAQASDRLAEAQSLLSQGGASTPRVPAALEDFTTQSQEGAQLLLSSFQTTRDPDSVDAVRSFAATSLPVLQEMAKTAPPAAQEKLAQAALALRDLDQQALLACASCSPTMPLLEVPDLFLLSAEARQVFARVSGTQLDNSHPAPTMSEPEQTTTVDTTQVSPTEPKAGSIAPDSTGAVLEEPTKNLQGTVDDTQDTLDGVVGGLLPPLQGTAEGLTGLLP